MSQAEVIENFSIDRDCEIGLAEQLKSRLSDFIRNNPAGTRIPPERVLASSLGISRVTVRSALNYFFSKGMILRKGRHGAFTAGVSGNQLEMHPMLIDAAMSSNLKTSLKFISFETLPQQRIFWEKAVNAFNVASPQVKISLRELPQNVSYHNYSPYILENGFDIVMFQNQNERFDDLLAPLPENILKKIFSDEYRLKDYGTGIASSVPVKSSTLLICWNKELADSLGVENIPERLKKGEMLELHYDAAKRMPCGSYAGGHIWDYFCMKGLKDGVDDLDQEFLEERFEEFAKFAGTPNMFITEQKYSLEFVDYFLRGQLLFYTGFSTYLFFYGKELPFETGAMFYSSDKGHNLGREGIYLGVYKNSPNKEAAFEFIDFMISEQPQNMLLEELWDSPCLKKSSLLFRDIFELTDKKSVDEYFACRPLLSWDQNFKSAAKYRFLNTETRDVLNALMKGELEPEKAAKIVCSRWRELPNEEKG